MSTGPASELSSSLSGGSSSVSKDAGVVVCIEVFDDKSEPSEQELFEYATKIGIDPDKEKHLLNLAKEGLLQKLPANWRPCWDSSVNDYYYYNEETRKSQWQHPLDDIYRNKVHLARQTRNDLQIAVDTEAEGIIEVTSDNSEALSEKADFMTDLAQPKPPPRLAPLPGGKPLAKAALPPLRQPPPARTASPLGDDSKCENESTSKKLWSSSKKGQSLLKNKIFDDKEEGHGTNEATEKFENPSRPHLSSVKGILKRPALGKDDSDDWRTVRAHEVENEKRRIQFDLQKEVSKLQQSSSTSEESQIFKERREDTEASPTTHGNGNDPKNNDFMTRHSLFDPEDLIVDDATLDEVDSLFQVKETLKLQESPQKIQHQTKLSRILNSKPESKGPLPSSSVMLKPVLHRTNNVVLSELVGDEDENVSSEENLGDIKLSDDTFNAMRGKAKENREINTSQREKVELKIHDPYVKDESNSNQLLEKTNSKKVNDLKVELMEHFEAEKEKIKANLSLAHEQEIAKLRTHFAVMVKEEEEKIKDHFVKEVERLRESMREDLEKERHKLLERFNSELSKEFSRLDEEQRVRKEAKEKEIEESLQKELDAYRERLAEEFETLKQKEISGIKASDRQQKIQDMQRTMPFTANYEEDVETIPLPSQRTSKSAKASLSVEFSEEMKALADDIKELRRQMREIRTRASSPKRAFEAKLQTQGMQRSRSNQNLDFSSSVEDDLFGGSLNKFGDLSHSLQNLQYRVDSLEKSILAYNIPYAIPPIFTLPGPQTFGEARIVCQNSWTVEEQIQRSKMWLKQRNRQTMSSKPRH